ncbi:MAG: hypothetical protein JF614_02975 [Acidobacteria bacterium]|nr:hypothetical protein [Acidobacteriota bacterium]
MSPADKRRKVIQEAGGASTVYSRALDRVLSVRDARAEFAQPSRKSASEERAEVQAFLASKKRLIQSHPQMTAHQKQAAIAEIDALSTAPAAEGAEEEEDPADRPPPGGVGYGFYYNPSYRVAWETGSALEFSIVCPTVPGGNVNYWLYLTATNRTGKGVEALVSYYAQNEFSFNVYDWARPGAQWQVDRPYSMLANYLGSLDIDGKTYQTLYAFNSTYQTGAGSWRNEVFLFNPTLQQLDLVYSYDYSATIGEQKAVGVGFWAPIVETFQRRYSGTNPLGFAYTNVMSRDAASRWGAWEALAPTNADLRQDFQSFTIAYLNPNDTWIVIS